MQTEFRCFELTAKEGTRQLSFDEVVETIQDFSGVGARNIIGFEPKGIHRLSARPRPNESRFDDCERLAGQLAELLGFGLNTKLGHE